MTAEKLTGVDELGDMGELLGLINNTAVIRE